MLMSFIGYEPIVTLHGHVAGATLPPQQPPLLQCRSMQPPCPPPHSVPNSIAVRMFEVQLCPALSNQAPVAEE